MIETPKKKGFFAKAFGRKSKEEKLAEAAALKAEQLALVDRQMAERMAAINAAALKSAREMDEQAQGKKTAEEQDRIEREERIVAEEQARHDMEAAKRLVEEQKQKAEAAREAAQLEQEARVEKERLESEKLAEEKLAAEKLAVETREREVQAAREAEEKAQKEQLRLAAEKEAVEKANAQEAAALKAKHEKEQAERTRLELERQEQEKLAQELRDREQQDRKQQAETVRLAQEKQERDTQMAAETAAQTTAETKAKTLDLQNAKIEAEKQKETSQKQVSEPATNTPIVEAVPPAEPTPSDPKKPGFLERISVGLKKSTSQMSDNVSALFNKRKLDAEALEELEDLLIASDLGVGPAMRTTALLAKDKFDKQITGMEIKIALADVIAETLAPLEKPLVLSDAKPQIMLFVGVNGSGKTTTLGKLASRYVSQGKKVLLCAGDTFRAAAVEQLKVWGERSDVPVVSAALGADAAGLVYDAIARARSENYDILMIDTAGRLQNRTELMDELSKIVRVIKKHDKTAPHHCLLVLDATVGQNALSQTEAFEKTAGVTGLIMTKLDGTAKGGVLVALADKFSLPIHAIGIGEGIDDLENFSAPVFAAALSGVADAVLETQ